MSWNIQYAQAIERLERTLPYKIAGKITKSLGLLYEAHLPGASIGARCRILSSGNMNDDNGIDAEVVGFRGKQVTLMPYEVPKSLHSDSLVMMIEKQAGMSVGPSLLGRVIDGAGKPMDEKGPLFPYDKGVEYRSLYSPAFHPLKRKLIEEPLDLGVRAINGMLTCGKGQRVGVMAGSGVGKSVLLGMMARMTSAQVNVIALCGERGREVREFLENELGDEGLGRSVVVVATSDASPLCRVRCAYQAATIAEYFRDQGKDVLLLMDSVTRFAMAQREIGQALGEPPTTKGYTASVFSHLAKLLERSGTSDHEGTITGLYTVLVEGDDLDEPIADAARSVLDGHLVLSRRIAHRNHFPAIDVLQSTSRVMRNIVSDDHFKMAGKIREWMALYAQVEDLINIGAYAKGSNVEIDKAIAVHDRIISFLRQDTHDPGRFTETENMMRAIVEAAGAQA